MNVVLEGVDGFLARVGWGDAAVEPIPGDASARRYFRVRNQGGARAMLMYAPPPHEDPAPFLHVADWLTKNAMRAPQIYASKPEDGWVLLEDFGDARMRDWLDEHPGEERAAYEAAIDALVELHRLPPGPFAPYDMATYLRETDLFTEWFCAGHGLGVDEGGYRQAWRDVLAPLCEAGSGQVTVLRDYHAENIMLLGAGGSGAPDLPIASAQGLIDFQDALVGHPAYDLVSLLQDARRDVSPALEAAMLARYRDKAAPGADFVADYARLGAQRNAKIIGIFTRLNARDGKPRYLELIPRVWEALERDLAHPALGPVASWFDANIPESLRASRGGVAAASGQSKP